MHHEIRRLTPLVHGHPHVFKLLQVSKQWVYIHKLCHIVAKVLHGRRVDRVQPYCSDVQLFAKMVQMLLNSCKSSTGGLMDLSEHNQKGFSHYSMCPGNLILKTHSRFASLILLSVHLALPASLLANQHNAGACSSKGTMLFVRVPIFSGVTGAYD